MSRNGYRSGNKSSFVDESLFGTGKPGATNNNAKSQVEFLEPQKVKGGTVNMGRGASGKGTLPPMADVVTLKRADLQRMLKASPMMTAADIEAARRDADAKREAAQAVSKVRKDRMVQLEAEARRAAPPSETEQLKARSDGATVSRASKLLQEEKDEVKHMNQMVLYSKCVTIRDAQIEEKKQMMAEEEDEQRRLDLMMEIERIKALEQYEERERQRIEERKRGSSVLQEQIAERQRERLRQEELRDQERIQMLKEIERLKEEEMQVVIERKAQAKVLMAEVAAANAEQIDRKELMKDRERDEDHKITAYIRQKDIRDAALASEKERVAKEKELETARLRAQQERAADKQSELDELRARRYQEAKEREWRAKERGTAERQSAMMDELADAREAQKNAKLKQRADMARVEHTEFMRVLDVNKQKESEEMTMTVTQMSINNKYKEALLAQIQANDEKRRKERQEHLQEGGRIRVEAAKEQQRLQEIKLEKLVELQVNGVPAKYRAELEKMKILS